jgi:hypothetical protein
LQIALFVAPLLIFVSYLFGKPMDTQFSRPEVFAVVASVYILFQISGDSGTNWIEGVQLLSVYVILGILFLSAGSCRALTPGQPSGCPICGVSRRRSIRESPRRSMLSSRTL